MDPVKDKGQFAKTRVASRAQGWVECSSWAGGKKKGNMGNSGNVKQGTGNGVGQARKKERKETGQEELLPCGGVLCLCVCVFFPGSGNTDRTHEYEWQLDELSLPCTLHTV